MKSWITATVGLLLMVSVVTSAMATENARIFMDGTAAYGKGDWPAAIEAFEQLADKGIENGRLFYNLGNAYLKNDDLGHALIWYERALKYIPHDPDLNFNYDYALTLTKDERGEQASPILRILFFWKYQLSPDTIRWIALILNAALWVSLAVLLIVDSLVVFGGWILLFNICLGVNSFITTPVLDKKCSAVSLQASIKAGVKKEF